MIHQ
jgi:hypothetical protein